MTEFLEDRFFTRIKEVYFQAHTWVIMDDEDAGMKDGVIHAVKYVLLAAMSSEAVEGQLKEWDSELKRIKKNE